MGVEEDVEKCYSCDKAGHERNQCVKGRNSEDGSNYQGRNIGSPITTKPISCPVGKQQHTPMSSEG